METTIKVHKVEEKLKKTGEKLEGVSPKGKFWKLWLINDKYSFFGFDEKKPELEGKTWQFDLKEEKSGNYTNYTISNPQEIISAGGNGDGIIADELVGINERLDKLAEFLKEKLK
jgi:hypothetical protein